MRTLRTARGIASQTDHHVWVQAMHAQMPGETRRIPPPDDVVGDAPPAVAYANGGEWVADCPDADACGGAEVVEPGWPFMCCRCANAAVGGRWRPVRWPANVRGIERALRARPLDRFRDWKPGKKIAALNAETRRMAEEMKW